MNERHEISIPAQWSEIEKVSSTTIDILEKHNVSEDSIQALNMVVCELVENSLKYGYYDEASELVRVVITINDGHVTVEVTNPFLMETRYHLERLDQTTQWIRGYQDPFQAYLEKLKEISKKPLDDEESGLGLARIAYEGQAILDFFVGDDEILNVSAVMDLE